MIKEIIISIIFLSLLFTGCTINKKDELKPIVNDTNAVIIELFNNKSDYQLGSIKMSEFIDSVKFIILEETDESLIRMISKIIFTSEYILTVDPTQGSIFFFDMNGKYVKKLSRRGQGPGEYLSISSCIFDGQQLIIYDTQSKKMLFYDLSGNFLREISKFCDGTIIRDIINLPNGNFLCYTFDCVGDVDEKYTGLWEVDANGNFLKNYFTYNIILPVLHYLPSHFQYLPNGAILLRDNTHNDIFHYRNGTVERYISYSINGNRLPEMVGFTMYKDKPKNIKAFKSQETDDYIITRWMDALDEPLFSVFSKKDKKVRYLDSYTYDEAVPGILSWLADSNRPDILVCELRGISEISVMSIEKYLADQNLPQSTRNVLQSLVSKIDGSENPILELLYIKK